MTTRQQISNLTRKLESLQKHRAKLAPKWEELGRQIESIQMEIADKLGIPMTTTTRQTVCTAPRGIHEAKYNSIYGRVRLTPAIIGKLKLKGNREAMVSQLQEMRDSGRLVKDSFNRFVLDGKLLNGGVKTL